MKKLILGLSACVFFLGTAAAQDIIIKNNGEEMQSKVVEIGDTQIKYRKFSNPTGPIYTVPAADVFVVKFENGTKEVITPAKTEAESIVSTSDSLRYAQVKKATKKAKEPLRDKTFYFGGKIDFGYAGLGSIFSEESMGGPVLGVGVFAEWMPNKYKVSGFGAGVGYMRYMLENKFNLSHLNLDLAWVVRPKKNVSTKQGLRIGIPISAKQDGVDVCDGCLTTVSLFVELNWSIKHFDLGGGLFWSFNNALDSGDTGSGSYGLTVHGAYRF